jgi:hypothetical protein
MIYNMFRCVLDIIYIDLNKFRLNFNECSPFSAEISYRMDPFFRNHIEQGPNIIMKDESGLNYFRSNYLKLICHIWLNLERFKAKFRQYAWILKSDLLKELFEHILRVNRSFSFIQKAKDELRQQFTCFRSRQGLSPDLVRTLEGVCLDIIMGFQILMRDVMALVSG